MRYSSQKDRAHIVTELAQGNILEETAASWPLPKPLLSAAEEHVHHI